MSSSSLQTQLELAIGLLLKLFEHRDRVAMAEAVAAAEELGVSRRTLQRATRKLSIREIHNGRRGAIWQWPSDRARACCPSR